MRRRDPRLPILFALATALLLPGVAAAHSELDTPTPADGTTVEGSPAVVEGTFTQDLADGSSLQLRGPDGTAIADGSVDADDPRRMVLDGVPPLDPGEYEVRWTTFSAEDGEGPVRGSWTFTVTAAPTPEPTVAPTPSDAPTGEPTAEQSPDATATPAPSASGDGGPPASDADVVLPIIAGLAIVVGAGLVLLRRRGRGSAP